MKMYENQSGGSFSEQTRRIYRTVCRLLITILSGLITAGEKTVS